MTRRLAGTAAYAGLDAPPADDRGGRWSEAAAAASDHSDSAGRGPGGARSSTRPPVVEVFRLGQPACLALAEGHVARISLAWWSDGHPPTPLFRRHQENAHTLVARWPTDARGRLTPDDLDRVRVCRWVVDERVLERLEEIHRDYPLDAHDLLVPASGGVRPCRRSLLSLVASHRPHLAARIAAEVARDQEAR